MHADSLVADLAVVLMVAAPAALLARRAGVPPILGYLAAGLVVGPYLPIPIFADEGRVESLSELGIVLVMFAVGLELRIARLLAVLPTAGATALIEVAALFGCGFAVGAVLDWSLVASVFLGASIAISSTMVAGRVLDERGAEPSSRAFVMSVLVVQDVLAIVLAAVLTAVAAGQGLSLEGLAIVVGELALSILLIVLVGVLVVPRLVRRVADTGNREMVLMLCVALCFGFAFLAEERGYSVALGAFVAGVLVAESGRGEEVEHIVKPLRDLFAAIFFVAIGMSVDPRTALEHLGLSVALTAVVVLAQLVTVSGSALLAGNGLRRSIFAGLALGQVGEFGFLLAEIGVQAGVAPTELRSVIVTVAVLTAFTTSPAVALAPRVVRAVDRALPHRLQSLLSVYTAWFEDLRRPRPRDPSAPSLPRLLAVLAIEGVVIAGLAGAAALGVTPLRELAAQRLGMAPPADLVVVVGVTAALIAVPAYGFLRASRAFAKRLAKRTFGTDEVTTVSGRLLEATVRLLLLLAVGGPCAVALAPVLGPGAGLALLATLVPAVAIVWRRIGDADAELRSSPERIAQLFEGASLESAPPARESVPSVGLGPESMTPLALDEDAHAVGRSLAQLDLRALTGATVVALRGADGESRFPAPAEPLAAGETLVLAGPSDALDRARALLLEGPVA